MITVKQMFNLTKEKNIPLLSDFDAIFWSEYVNNFSKYDIAFRRMFLSFSYFLQDDVNDESVEEVTTSFIEDVKSFLLCNNKKYSELYRTYVVNDEEYMLLDNYNVTETKNSSITNENVYDYGARSENENTTIGSREDVSQSTTSTSDRTDTNNSTVGSQNNTNISTVAPYDEDVFHNRQKDDNNIGSRTDNSTNVIGAQTVTDENTNSLGEQINSFSSNTNAFQNTSSLNESENYTLTKKGNIGVQTGADMLQKHEAYWTKYEFYTLIFKDISDALLILVD